VSIECHWQAGCSVRTLAVTWLFRSQLLAVLLADTGCYSITASFATSHCQNWIIYGRISNITASKNFAGTASNATPPTLTTAIQGRPSTAPVEQPDSEREDNTGAGSNQETGGNLAPGQADHGAAHRTDRDQGATGDRVAGWGFAGHRSALPCPAAGRQSPAPGSVGRSAARRLPLPTALAADPATLARPL